MAKNLNIENIKNIEKILLPLINAFQNDEKEKLNHLGNISKSLIEVREKVKAEMEKLPPQFNVLRYIKNQTEKDSLSTFETYNSDLIRELLITNFKYKDKEGKKEFEVNFTKLFLEFMNDKFKNEIDLNNISWKKSIIDKEYGVKVEKEDKTTNRRIDLIIRYNDKEKSFAVIIENKTKRRTGDQDSQIKDYYDKIIKEYKNVYAIYLTPEGKEPSENSLPEEYYKKENGKLYGKFANITHGDIGRWIETILKNKEYVFLHKENYKLLKSALIQIIDNEKSISGENEESDMTKDEIENVLKENLFKEIKTVEKAQEYIDMFENAKVLLEEKKAKILEENRKAFIEKNIPPYLKFTKDVKKYLESKGYEDFYGIEDDNHIIENNFYPLGLGELYPSSGLGIQVLLQADGDYENNSIIYQFGIWTVDENIINKIKKKQPKADIENIFNNFGYYYTEEEKEWIFHYSINIEKDNPKEIAQAMIDLYELLKKYIK